MERFTRYCLLAPVVLTMTLLAISVGRHLVHRVAMRVGSRSTTGTFPNWVII